MARDGTGAFRHPPGAEPRSGLGRDAGTARNGTGGHAGGRRRLGPRSGGPRAVGGVLLRSGPLAASLPSWRPATKLPRTGQTRSWKYLDAGIAGGLRPPPGRVGSTNSSSLSTASTTSEVAERVDGGRSAGLGVLAGGCPGPIRAEWGTFRGRFSAAGRSPERLALIPSDLAMLADLISRRTARGTSNGPGWRSSSRWRSGGSRTGSATSRTGSRRMAETSTRLLAAVQAAVRQGEPSENYVYQIRTLYQATRTSACCG